MKKVVAKVSRNLPPRCKACLIVLENGRCPRCYGKLCITCHHPVFCDEGYRDRGHGPEHLRDCLAPPETVTREPWRMLGAVAVLGDEEYPPEIDKEEAEE